MRAGVDKEDEIEHGTKLVRKVQDPREPSQEERALHEMTRLPCRSWCRHCVRGREQEMPHQGGAPETNMSEVHLDFAFLGREEDPLKTMAVLVTKQRTREVIRSAAAHQKATWYRHCQQGGGLLARSRVSARRCGREDRSSRMWCV